MAKVSIQNVYQLNYEYFAALNDFNTSSKADSYGCSNGNSTAQQDATQEATAEWTRNCMFVYYPTVLLSFILFSLSDRYGRRIILLFCVLGQFAYSLLNLVQLFYGWPIELQLLANGLNGITGGQSLLLGVSFAGLVDISNGMSSQYRATRILIGELSIGFGGFAFFELNTLLIIRWGLVAGLLFNAALQLILCCYILVFITDKYQQFPEDMYQTHREACGWLPWDELKRKYGQSLSIYSRKRSDNRTIVLWLLVVTYILNVSRDLGQSSIIDLYEKKAPFCWTRPQVSTARSIGELVFGVGIVLSLLLGRAFKDKCSISDLNFYLITIGIFANVASSLLYGYSEPYESSVMLYTAIILPVILAPAITPLLKSQWVSFCQPNEHGAVFALPTLLMSISTGLAGLLYLEYYPILFNNVFFAFSLTFDLLSLVFFLLATAISLHSLHREAKHDQFHTMLEDLCEDNA